MFTLLPLSYTQRAQNNLRKAVDTGSPFTLHGILVDRNVDDVVPMYLDHSFIHKEQILSYGKQIILTEAVRTIL